MAASLSAGSARRLGLGALGQRSGSAILRTLQGTTCGPGPLCLTQVWHPARAVIRAAAEARPSDLPVPSQNTPDSSLDESAMALNENLWDKAFQERVGAVVSLFKSESIELGPDGPPLPPWPWPWGGGPEAVAKGPSGQPRGPRLLDPQGKVGASPGSWPPGGPRPRPASSLHSCSSGLVSPDLSPADMSSSGASTQRAPLLGGRQPVHQGPHRGATAAETASHLVTDSR